MSEAKWWCIKASNFECTEGTRKLDPFFLVYSLFTTVWMMGSLATLLLWSVSRCHKHSSPMWKNEWIMETIHPPLCINFWCPRMFRSLMERQAWIPYSPRTICSWLGDRFFWYHPSSWRSRQGDVLSGLFLNLTAGSHLEAKQGKGECRWESKDHPGLCPYLHPWRFIFLMLLKQSKVLRNAI